ncbi:amidohydrolase family protein [bacterium]|jgi:cytosine/adenosine deaminase-related metal-dependent hydrolase|nr:amidohydrolase family protein [bacterium]
MISYHVHTIVPVTSQPITDAYVSCKNGIIQSISKNKPNGKIVGIDGVLYPGLINAHTHLEFSDLKKPLGVPGTPFTDWIKLVMEYRTSRDQERLHTSITKGLAESESHGVSAIGDISTFEYRDSIVPATAEAVVFRELIGFQAAQADSQMKIAEDHLSEPESNWYRPALSPHAPYSTNKKILDQAIQLSHKRKIPLAMHLAETREELELLASHSGPFFDLLNQIGVWEKNNLTDLTKPLDFLQRLSCASRALVVHGNYLNNKELQFISENRDILHLVFCPRTHAFFQHDRYPLEEILKRDIPIAIGTDSRASNPDLSIWDELQHIASKFPEISPHNILKMGTINSAKALGVDKHFGSIEVGKRAAFFLPPKAKNMLFSGASY